MTHRIELWTWELDRPGEAALLAPDERTRAAAFATETLRARFIAGRSGLRLRLGAHLGLDPARIAFRYNRFGRPELPGGPSFNLSHCGGLAALALCSSAAVGVDIEAIRPIERAVATRFFAPSELQALEPLAGADWEQAFFRLWTRKEAFLKAVGTGLDTPLASFDVTAEDSPRLIRAEGQRVQDWTLIHLSLAPDLPGAVAVESRGAPVELLRRD
ncbi:4'-phosphopantetheinyl transferase superfamily protein [Cereibacter sphaeroides]|uniref:4'-phosphopantetheinyl transferase family protein n=1 Tax=Cereibacter sphaeroides TaxID=1063 RepID=UPI001F185304|nr:4'-phosphopantetheinyl transferase superfamily protein [Cereibacter sphaeroides]MCE6950259.1 4'-phosphopantetheinyl transferase superfamily protein [Cereibacter sphaeroides]